MYRRTKSTPPAQWRPRQEIPDGDQRPPRWQPPDLRRRITIEDFDGAEPMTHVIELHKPPASTYRAVVDGREWKTRIGWSRVLDGLRRSMPRIASERTSSL